MVQDDKRTFFSKTSGEHQGYRESGTPYYAGRRTDIRDQKSRDFSGEIFWREITAREQVSRAVILEKF